MKLLIIVLTLWASLSANAQGLPTLGEIEVILDKNQSLPLSRNIVFSFDTKEAEQVVNDLKNWNNIKAISNQDKKVDIVISGNPVSNLKIKQQYTQESFVIDYKEEDVQQLISDFKKSTIKPWTPNKIAMHISDYISDPTYIHGFMIASRVAQKRSGDCTEYAVLSAALARSLGIPSKVILGTVFFEVDSQISAFGHAWTEVWFNNQWNVLDAALFDDEVNQLFYLPSGELENEGTGYSMSLLSSVLKLPKKIYGLKNY